MFSVPGIYDDGKVFPTEKIKVDKKYKVIITFVEELNVEGEEAMIRDFTDNSAFSFWENKKEDIYQDLISSKTNRPFRTYLINNLLL